MYSGNIRTAGPHFRRTSVGGLWTPRKSRDSADSPRVKVGKEGTLQGSEESAPQM